MNTSNIEVERWLHSSIINILNLVYWAMLRCAFFSSYRNSSSSNSRRLSEVLSISVKILSAVGASRKWFEMS